METNNNTLTTAAAWRAAISLTCADVRAFLSTVFIWAKIVFAFVYLMGSLLLVVSESESVLPNVIGFALLGLLALYVKRNDNK